MNKRLKLDALASPRSLRSGSKAGSTASSSTTSKYFNDENTSPKKPEKRKRAPIKIEYEKTETARSAESCEVKKEDSDEKNLKKVKAEGNDWTPLNWQATLENVKEMRKHKTAPVDEMGCHKCADPKASGKVSRFQSLVALMLSSQTKDQVTHAAMQRLNTYGCTPETIAGTPDVVLGKLIYPAGFWKVQSLEY